MLKRTGGIRRSMVAAVLAVLAAACTGDSSTVSGGSSSPSGTAEPSTPAASPESPSVPQAEIEDGMHFVFVKKAGDADVTFDLAYLLSGMEAAEAAQEAGDEVPVPNDYYIVNDNPKLRTVPVADGVQVHVYDWSKCCDTHTPIGFDDFTRYVADPTDDFHGAQSPYWLRVRGGEITRIEEQFLP